MLGEMDSFHTSSYMISHWTFLTSWTTNLKSMTTVSQPPHAEVRLRSAVEMISAGALLFASLMTLSCCALPVLLALRGLGLTNVLIFVTAMPCWESFGVYET